VLNYDSGTTAVNTQTPVQVKDTSSLADRTAYPLILAAASFVCSFYNTNIIWNR